MVVVRIDCTICGQQIGVPAGSQALDESKCPQCFEREQLMPVRYFEFRDEEGVYIAVAKHAREAINYFFNEYQDDVIIDDQLRYGGVTITELTDEQIDTPYELLDHSLGQKRTVTYRQVFEEDLKKVPVIIVYPTA